MITDPRIAVIGCGYWGKNLVRNFAQLRVLSVICDEDEKILKAQATLYPQVRATTRFGEVLEALALQHDQGAALVELSRKTGLTLMVGHILEYRPAVTLLKDLILRKELGRILYIYSNRLNLGKVRQVENILWSFAPHEHRGDL